MSLSTALVTSGRVLVRMALIVSSAPYQSWTLFEKSLARQLNLVKTAMGLFLSGLLGLDALSHDGVEEHLAGKRLAIPRSAKLLHEERLMLLLQNLVVAIFGHGLPASQNHDHQDNEAQSALHLVKQCGPPRPGRSAHPR